mmetsp:Transcript_17310/g.32833  ORF Transcript_17310/g.32833 Transcript_17310/m.32833 type:complete len:228 (+) Transcript_17310:69-752(+)|eukprot:scaffold968_cov171-Amphora_coffeaeformis.AAC.13
MNTTDFVDLNEQGLFHLDDDEYHEAIRSFREALTRLNAQRRGTERPTLGDPHIMSFHAYPIPLESPELVQETSSPDGQFFIFDRAFLFEFSDLRHDYPFVVSAILYNLALTIHVQGLRNHSPRKLRQAQEVYHRALDFLKNSRRATLRATQGGDRRVLFLALANNYGHCSSHLFDEAGVEQAENLLGLILSDAHTTLMLTPTELYHLRVCCMIGFLRRCIPQVAPAA